MGWAEVPFSEVESEFMTPSGALPRLKDRPRFSPEVEQYRSQAEQDLNGDQDAVDNYLSSLQGGTEPPKNNIDRQRKIRLAAQSEADRQAQTATTTAETTNPLSLATGVMGAYNKAATAVTPRPVRAALGKVKDVAGDVAAEVAPSIPGAASYDLGRSALSLAGVRLPSSSDIGRTAAESLTPTTLPDLALTALPFAEGAARGAAGVRAGVGKALAGETGQEVPQVLYHWTPTKNVESILKNGLNPGSWLAATPEEAVQGSRLPGLRGGGTLLEVNPNTGEVRTARNTLTRQPAFRSNTGLTATNPQEVTGQSTLDRVLTGGETGSVTVPGGTPDDLTKALEDSLKIGKEQGPDALRQQGAEKAQGVAAEMKAEAQQGAGFYKEQGTLKKRAGKLSQLMDEFKGAIKGGESGAVTPESQGLGAIEDLKNKIKEHVQGGASWAEIEPAVNDLNKLMKDLVAEHKAAATEAFQSGTRSAVPHQPVPPGQPALGEGERQLAPGEAKVVQGPKPPELTPEQQAEYLRTTGRQPSLEQGIPEAGPQPPESAFTLKQQQLEAQLQHLKETRNSLLLPEDAASGTAGAPPKPPTGPGGPDQYGFGGEFPESNADNSGSLLKEVVKSIANIPGESIANVSALSPPLLRAGVVRLVTAPAAAFREFGASVRNAFSEERAADMLSGLRSGKWIRPTEGGASNSGRTWEDLGGHVLQLGDAPEERQTVANNWLSRKLQGFGPRKISDRQAVLELNAHRMNWYSSVAENMDKAGIRDPNEYKRVVNRIEHWTQRGSLGNPSNLPLAFSMRAQSGRVQGLVDIIHDIPVGVLTGSIRHAGPEQEAAKALVGMVGANMALMYGATHAGLGHIEIHGGLPILRSGKFHLDPWAGWNGTAKLVLGVGKDIYQEYGRAIDAGGWGSVPEDFATKEAQRFAHFVQGQLSPVPSLVASTATRTDYAGNYFDIGKEIRSGQILADLTLPFNVRDIAEAYNASGPLAAAGIALPATLSAGTGVYNSLGEKRDDLARAGVTYQENGETKTDTAQSYQDLNPLARAAIDNTQEIKDYRKEHPNLYQHEKAQAEAKNLDVRNAVHAEENFSQDKPITQPIREFWSSETTARRAMSDILETQFASQFSGFNKDKYQKDVEAYYNTTGAPDDAGNVDPDATALAREKFVATLPADEQQWVNESLQATRESKTPLHQEYLGFLDAKDAAGYFKPGITQAERDALDRDNPGIDVQNWRFGGLVKDSTGEIKAGPALQSVTAVTQALGLNLNPETRPIKYANIPRPINESPDTLQAWQKSQNVLDFYEQAGTPELQDQIAKAVYKGKPYSQLEDSEKSGVKQRIRNSISADPNVEATLFWWGVIEKPKTVAGIKAFQTYADQYGPLMKGK